MPVALDEMSASALGKHIYVFGGKVGGSEATADTYRYDTEADEWATLEPMPEPRRGHASVVLGGLIYILGNSDDESCSVLRYDPASGSWSRLPPVPSNRYDFTAFVLRGHLYAAGGELFGVNGNRVTTTSLVERYDAEADSWSPVADLRTARAMASVAVVGDAGDGGEMDLFESTIARSHCMRVDEGPGTISGRLPFFGL